MVSACPMIGRVGGLECRCLVIRRGATCRGMPIQRVLDIWVVAAEIEQAQRAPFHFAYLVTQNAAFLELGQHQVDLHRTQIELVVRRKGMRLYKKKREIWTRAVQIVD